LHVDLNLGEKRTDICRINDLQQPIHSLPPWRQRPPPAAIIAD
jgi:hypothetical protein